MCFVAVGRISYHPVRSNYSVTQWPCIAGRQSGFSSERAQLRQPLAHRGVCVFRMPVITTHPILMIDEPRLLTPNAKTNTFQIGLQGVIMTEISHTSCLRHQKLKIGSNVSALTTVSYDQMRRRQILYCPQRFISHPLTFKFRAELSSRRYIRPLYSCFLFSYSATNTSENKSLQHSTCPSLLATGESRLPPGST